MCCYHNKQSVNSLIKKSLSYREGSQYANYLINVLLDYDENTFKECYIKVSVVELGRNAFIDLIAHFKRGEHCSVTTLNNKGLTFSATNPQGTIELDGITNSKKLLWKAEIISS